MKFRDLPFIAKIVIGLTFYNTWVLFEETVIDRHGLSKFLPLYEVGCFCIWDVAAIVTIICALIFLNKRIEK